MVLWRLTSRLYLSGATLTGVGILVPNLYNSHKFVMQSFKNDGPVECLITAFTYTWLATVKSFGAGLVWPLTWNDGLARQRTNPDSLKLYWTLDKEYDFIRDNAQLKQLLRKK